MDTNSCVLNSNTKLTFSTQPSSYLGCNNTKRGLLPVGDLKSARRSYKSLPWGFNCLVFPTLFFLPRVQYWPTIRLYFLWPVVYILTYSTVQSPSWEANWLAASQEIPRILWNPKVHYRIHKPPPPISILGQPIQSINPHPTSWRSILILSTHLLLGLPSGILSSGFPTKTLYTPLSSPIRATCPGGLHKHCAYIPLAKFPVRPRYIKIKVKSSLSM